MFGVTTAHRDVHEAGIPSWKMELQVQAGAGAEDARTCGSGYSGHPGDLIPAPPVPGPAVWSRELSGHVQGRLTQGTHITCFKQSLNAVCRKGTSTLWGQECPLLSQVRAPASPFPLLS